MTLQPSRLLVRLDSQIAAATLAFDADCLIAERACYRARQGRIEEALQVATTLRERYLHRPNAVISTWTNLVEGLCSHFDDMGEMARDKFRRAHAMSAAPPVSHLHLLCAAWLAHVDYTHHDAVAMAQHAREALQFAAPDDHAVRSRASLVVAQVLHLGSGLDRAEPWYGVAHRHALAEGDDLTIAALIHNRAGLQLSRLGEAALQMNGSAAVAQALSELASSQSYDRLIGAASQSTIAPLIQAQILCLRGDAAAALSLFESHIGSAADGGLARMAAPILADQAWCRAQLGQTDAARADAQAALASLVAKTHVDDRAATHSRVAEVLRALGDGTAADHHAGLAAEHWQAFERLKEQMAGELDGLQPPAR